MADHPYASGTNGLTPTKPGRIIELDGLRGVAVLMVLFAHYFAEVPNGVSFLALGWLGVDVFFVLSGFLIAGILLDNRHAKNYFSTFYMRRSCRIFPIYFLLIPFIAAFFTSLYERGYAWMESPLPLVAYLSYTQNFFIAWSNDTGGLALLPTWTLAIEEQFYMLLPLLVFLVPKKRLMPVCLALIVASPIARSVLLSRFGDHLSVNVFLPCRWDSLFLGVVAAIVWRDNQLKSRALANNGALLRNLWGVCYASLPVMILIERTLGLPLRMSVGLTLFGLGTAAYILLVVSGRGLSVGWLRSKTLRFFGAISYGLYLVHQPVLVLMHGFLLGDRPDVATGSQLAITVVALFISVGLAWLSWTFFELRFVRLGHNWKYEGSMRPTTTKGLAA